MKKIKPIVLAILDGWGIAPPWGGNAIALARTPNFNNYWAKYPKTSLNASGVDVGLPGDEMGNSEVGHLNIGAGRVIKQDMSIITSAIEDGSFFQNKILIEGFKNARNNNLHIMGLVSDGSVHSNINHLYALIEMAKKFAVKNVFIHAFTDGRDTDPMTAIQYISRVQEKIQQCGIGQIASISGRYFAMDRDNHWERIQRVYGAMVEGRGEVAKNPLQAISASYSSGVMDEFIPPTVIVQDGPPITIKDRDTVIFFNFRADRAREITQSLIQQNFSSFRRNIVPKNLFFITMVPYVQEDWGLSIRSAFSQKNIKNTLAEVLSQNNLRQLHIAETEKYAHVTYFFNGAVEKPFPGEDRKIIPSPRVATYDLVPQMSAEKITEYVVKKMEKYDFILVNFANADMVGHTGSIPATITAVEFVDKCLKIIADKCYSLGGLLVVTADHGNAEEMISKNGGADTEHSTSKVPFILVDGMHQFQNFHEGRLADIAPTILNIWKIPKPKEMTGNTLFGAYTMDHQEYRV